MPVDPYLIAGTNTLKNKLGITDADQLADAERIASSRRIASLSDNPIPGNLDYDHLKAIHKHIFQDIYEWAGEPRSVPIAKGESLFALPQHIDDSANTLLGELADEDHLRDADRATFVDRSAHYLNELNAIHTFREGNGRVQRAFMDHVAAEAGRAFQWSRVSPQEMIDASIYGHDKDPSKLKDVLDKALIEPQKKKEREERLADIAATDPAAHKLIQEARTNILSVSAHNIDSQDSRQALADAMTDRMLSYHESGRDLKELLKQDQLTQRQQPDRNRDDRSR